MSEVNIIKKMKKKVKAKPSNNIGIPILSNQQQTNPKTITPMTKSKKEMKNILALLLETMISEQGLITKNDLHELNKQHNDEINLLKDEIKKLEKKNDDILLDVASIVELERQKRLQLIKKVYKKHNDDYEKLNKDINVIKDDSSDTLYNIQNNIKTFSKNIDELGLHCFGHSFTKNDSPRRKKKIENNNSSHFDERDIVNNSYDNNNNNNNNGVSIKGLGGVALREMVNDLQLDFKELEAEVGDIRHLFMETMKITKEPNNNNKNVDNSNDNKLSIKIKELGRHSANACSTLASGLNEVQQTTVLLYKWAGNVHNSFSIVSDKLKLDKNLCPPVPSIGSGKYKKIKSRTNINSNRNMLKSKSNEKSIEKYSRNDDSYDSI